MPLPEEPNNTTKQEHLIRTRVEYSDARIVEKIRHLRRRAAAATVLCTLALVGALVAGVTTLHESSNEHSGDSQQFVGSVIGGLLLASGLGVGIYGAFRRDDAQRLRFPSKASEFAERRALLDVSAVHFAEWHPDFQAGEQAPPAHVASTEIIRVMVSDGQDFPCAPIAGVTERG